MSKNTTFLSGLVDELRKANETIGEVSPKAPTPLRGLARLRASTAPAVNTASAQSTGNPYTGLMEGVRIPEKWAPPVPVAPSNHAPMPGWLKGVSNWLGENTAVSPSGELIGGVKQEEYDKNLAASYEPYRILSSAGAQPFIQKPEERAKEGVFGPSLKELSTLANMDETKTTPERARYYERVDPALRAGIETAVIMGVNAGVYALGDYASGKLEPAFSKIETAIIKREMNTAINKWVQTQAKYDPEFMAELSAHLTGTPEENRKWIATQLRLDPQYQSAAFKLHAAILGDQKQAFYKTAMEGYKRNRGAGMAEQPAAQSAVSEAIKLLPKLTETNTGVPGQTVPLADIQRGVENRLKKQPSVPSTPVQPSISVGSTITDGLVNGEVIGVGQYQFGKMKVDGYKIRILSGAEKGKTSFIAKEDAKPVEQPAVKPQAQTTPVETKEAGILFEVPAVEKTSIADYLKDKKSFGKYDYLINEDRTIDVYNAITGRMLGTISSDWRKVSGGGKADEFKQILENEITKVAAGREIDKLRDYPVKNADRIKKLKTLIGETPEVLADYPDLQQKQSQPIVQSKANPAPAAPKAEAVKANKLPSVFAGASQAIKENMQAATSNWSDQQAGTKEELEKFITNPAMGIARLVKQGKWEYQIIPNPKYQGGYVLQIREKQSQPADEPVRYSPPVSPAPLSQPIQPNAIDTNQGIPGETAPILPKEATPKAVGLAILEKERARTGRDMESYPDDPVLLARRGKAEAQIYAIGGNASLDIAEQNIQYARKSWLDNYGGTKFNPQMEQPIIDAEKVLADIKQKPVAPEAVPGETAPGAGAMPVSQVAAPEKPKAAPPKEPPKPPITTAAEPKQPAEDPIKKLTRLIKEAKPARRETEALKHEEKKQRVARAAGILEGNTGRGAFKKSTSPLAGEYPKAQFDPPESGLTPEDITSLFEKVRTSELRYFEKLNTAGALEKVLLGQIPQEQEIVLLEQMFGEEFAKAILSKRSLWQKGWTLFVDVANLPRSFQTAIDLSGTLRQGGVLAARHPVMASKAFTAEIRAFANKEFARGIDKALKERKYFDLADSSGLYLAPLEGATPQLNEREEAFISRIAGKVPGVGASNRAYVTYLNKLRADVFDYYAAIFEKQGAVQADFDELAKFVNYASGRGDLGKFERSAAALSGILYSPRYQASRLELPTMLFSSSPKVRKIAAENLTVWLGMGITALSLLVAAGAKVELDPRSSDFGKGRIGNTRFDLFSGYLQYVRNATQMVTGQRKTESGNEEDVNRWDIFTRFLQGKFSPAMSLIVDLLAGKNFLGEKMELTPEVVGREAEKRMVPIFIQDLIEAYEDGGISSAFKALPSVVGVGVQTYGMDTEAADKAINRLGQADTEARDSAIDKAKTANERQKATDKDWTYTTSNLATELRDLVGEKPLDRLKEDRRVSPLTLNFKEYDDQRKKYEDIYDKDQKTKDALRAACLKDNPDFNLARLFWGKDTTATASEQAKLRALAAKYGVPENAIPALAKPKVNQDKINSILGLPAATQASSTPVATGTPKRGLDRLR